MDFNVTKKSRSSVKSFSYDLYNIFLGYIIDEILIKNFVTVKFEM